ncbi:hypothetical protein, partial [Myxococcus llanfairpwllgwyngyllgogerychwyrndrobwllllantysiliogogogochensis]|uniref:hypothetical protein n=1 Tax=Myxococcus llanfairpwllgwyngyllgogerychwyrndrobwllllantysiliogogogochensis TaxID=2590453 RepID=UPI001C67A61D
TSSALDTAGSDVGSMKNRSLKRESALEYSIDRGNARRVYEALVSSAHQGIDAYRIAQKSGLTSMECGQLLRQFERCGIAESGDPKDTENDLARVFRVCGERPGAECSQASRGERGQL